MDLNWTLPVLLQHQYSWLMHSLLSVYSLCTLWWRWTCESLCCLLVFWHCQEPEEALRSHPAAACRSKPSTKAAEGRRFFYLELCFFFSQNSVDVWLCTRWQALYSPVSRTLQTSPQYPEENRKCSALLAERKCEKTFFYVTVN